MTESLVPATKTTPTRNETLAKTAMSPTRMKTGNLAELMNAETPKTLGTTANFARLTMTVKTAPVMILSWAAASERTSERTSESLIERTTERTTATSTGTSTGTRTMLVWADQAHAALSGCGNATTGSSGIEMTASSATVTSESSTVMMTAHETTVTKASSERTEAVSPKWASLKRTEAASQKLASSGRTEAASLKLMSSVMTVAASEELGHRYPEVETNAT